MESLQQRQMHSDEALHRDQGREQLRRSDQVAQAQGGKEHLAKGPDIHHAPGAIQACASLLHSSSASRRLRFMVTPVGN